MSIAINLLPDTRQAKQKSSQRRKLVFAGAVAVWVVCGSILGLMIISVASETLIIKSLTSSINQKKAELERTPDIIDALTAQQHLNALPGLYQRRVYLSKFYDAYGQVNPVDVKLNALSVNATNVLTVSGTATTYASVAKLSKAMEAERITSGELAFGPVLIVDTTKVQNTISFTLSTTIEGGTLSGK